MVSRMSTRHEEVSRCMLERMCGEPREKRHDEVGRCMLESSVW